MTNALHDLKLAVRSLRKSPGFAIAVLATLMLGIGANSAIFSVVRGVLLRPLPFAAPERLVVLWETDRHNGSQRQGASAPDLQDWRAETHSFAGLAAYGRRQVNLTGEGEAERLQAAAVSDDFFAVLGREPILGRGFRREENRIGAPGVAILSADLWRRRFGGRDDVIGRSLTIESQPFTVIGVQAAAATYPEGTELWVPLRPALGSFNELRGAHGLTVLGRLKPEVSLADAQRDLSAVMLQLEGRHADSNAGRGAFVEDLHEAVVGNARGALLLVWLAVGLLLCVACANVASLSLARATARRRELAIRQSLGASRGKLLRLLLIESVVLAGGGGLAGLLFGATCTRFLLRVGSSGLPRMSDVHVDWSVLLFTLTVSLAASLLCGLAPAMIARRVPAAEALAAGRMVGEERGVLRRALVVAELAVALILVFAAGLLGRSFLRLTAVDPGFEARGVVVFQASLPASRYPVPPRAEYPRWPQATELYDRLLGALAAAPGADAFALALNQPLQQGWTTQVDVDGVAAPAGHHDEVRLRPVTAQYFAALGVPLRSGRGLSTGDREGSHEVVVINDAFARRYFPGVDPVGHKVSVWGREKEIVGVAGDERFLGLAQDAQPALYPSLFQFPMGDITIVARTRGAQSLLTASVREAVRSVDPGLALYNVRPLEQIVHDSVGDSRFRMALVLAFGVLALLLGAVGVAGLVSYQVQRQRRELGVRVAVGASPPQIRRLVVARSARLAGLGVGLGLFGALAIGRGLGGVLFGIAGNDATTLAGSALVLMGVASAAAWIPAMRASRVDPLVALRED